MLLLYALYQALLFQCIIYPFSRAAITTIVLEIEKLQYTETCNPRVGMGAAVLIKASRDNL